jgi:hypothetical protein
MAFASEADWTAYVIDLAHRYGWLVAHFRPARTATGWRTPVQADGAGFPDLVLVNPWQRQLVFAELKARNGHPSRAQLNWLANLADVENVGVYVWRPDQAADVERVLKGEGA